MRMNPHPKPDMRGLVQHWPTSEDGPQPVEEGSMLGPALALALGLVTAVGILVFVIGEAV